MFEQGEPSSSSGPAAGPSKPNANPHSFIQPPAGHTSTILDPQQEEYLPNRKDPKGEEKISALGELKGGREYVCDTIRSPGSDSQRLFFSATSCAHILGYPNVESMVWDNPSLFLVSKSTVPGTEPDHDTLVSSLSMFRQFGHRLVKRGRAVFDDYFETFAAEQGIEDNTIWAAVGGDIPDDTAALAILRQVDIDDLELEDSTGLTQIDSMIIFFFHQRLRRTRRESRVETVPALMEELARLFGRILASNGHSYAQWRIRSSMNPFLLKLSNTPYQTSLVHQILSAALAYGSLGAGASTRETTAMGNEGSPAVLVAEWMVPAVVEQSRLAGSIKSVSAIVSSFVVITGSGSDYECAQCKDIVRARWGEYGSLVLQWLCEAVGSVLMMKDSETIRVQNVELQDSAPRMAPPMVPQRRLGGRPFVQMTPDFLCSADRSILVLSGLSETFKECRRDLISFLEIISWVCAALRPPGIPGENLDAASTQMFLSCTRQWQLDNISDEVGSWLFLGSEPLKPMKTLGTPHNCWMQLFLSVTIVETNLQRSWGRGLKISFSLMCRLAAIQNAWDTSTGLVLFGFFTALIPTEVETSGLGIQWHFECQDAERGLLLPKDLSMPPQVELKIPHIESNIGLFSVLRHLRNRECFIGWHPSANIMLGTKRLVDETLPWDWTHSLQPVPRKLEKSGYETAGQVGVEAGPVTLTAVATQQQAYVAYKVRFEPSSDYQTTLLDQEGKSCLLIDKESEQAWLVPLLSVLLHMCHRYGQIQLAKGRPTKIPFAAESPLGDHAVREAIKDFGLMNIFVKVSHGEIFFSELFHGLLFRLKMVELPVPEPSRIFAVEVMDIITKKDTSPKALPCSRWGSHLMSFASLVDIVAVAEGIGHAIRPLSEQRCTCTRSCHELPAHRGYLAAHVSALESLRGAGHGVFKVSDAVGSGRSQLTPETCWVPRHDPWMWSAHDQATCRGVWMHQPLTDMVVQETTSNVRAPPPSQASLTNIPQDGVIVFGTHRRDAELLRQFIGNWFRKA